MKFTLICLIAAVQSVKISQPQPGDNPKDYVTVGMPCTAKHATCTGLTQCSRSFISPPMGFRDEDRCIPKRDCGKSVEVVAGHTATYTCFDD